MCKDFPSREIMFEGGTMKEELRFEVVKLRVQPEHVNEAQPHVVEPHLVISINIHVPFSSIADGMDAEFDAEFDADLDEFIKVGGTD